MNGVGNYRSALTALVYSYYVAWVEHAAVKLIWRTLCYESKCWLADEMFFNSNTTESPKGPAQTALAMAVSHPVKLN